jgi:hypothetical protein
MQQPELAPDELARVRGGAGQHHQQHWNPLGFLDGPYKSLVFHYASQVGGTKLADSMYGKHATAGDRARAQAAMKQFLVTGGKLPKGAPDLFG